MSSGRGWIRRIAGSAIDLWLPPACNLCAVPLPSPGVQPMLCSDCQAALRNLKGPACSRCAAPVAAVGGGTDCPRCRGHRFAFESAVAMGIYRDVLRDAVIRMKQRVHEPLTLSVGYLLAATVGERVSGGSWDLLVPIPTHWTKRWLRGLHGPDLLVEAMRKRMGIVAKDRVLRSRRRTRKQGTLLPAERRRNVRGAFAVTAGYDIRGARILLVDDILTTGATAHEAARTLRRGGAASVTVAVVARGVGLSQRDSSPPASASPTAAAGG